MSSPVPAPPPAPPDDFRLAIERLRSFTIISDSGKRFLKGSAITAFSELECSFVPTGQTDSAVRDDVRGRLRAADVKPIADLLQASVACRSAVHAADRQSPGWIFLAFPDAAGRAGEEAGLAPLQIYWLRLTAYCLVVAHGPAGAALPPLPRTPDEERRPPEQQPARVQLAFVPGDGARFWFGDDGDAVSGLPDAEHDPDDPKSTGWHA